MTDLGKWGISTAYPFKISYNGIGQSLDPAIDLTDGDVKIGLFSAGGTGTWTNAVLAGGAGVQEVWRHNETNAPEGFYYWKPISASMLQADHIIISITDTGGAGFDQNAVYIYTGGNTEARFDGT